MVDVNSCGGMNFGSDSFVTPNLKFINFGVVSVNATDKLESVSTTAAIVGRPISRSKW